jgi:hypothetical protein
VDTLLRADQAVIIEKLDAVSATLASLMSQVTEFRGLTLTMMPTAELSEQAAAILRRLVNSTSSYFLRIKWMGGVLTTTGARRPHRTFRTPFSGRRLKQTGLPQIAHAGFRCKGR